MINLVIVGTTKCCHEIYVCLYTDTRSVRGYFQLLSHGTQKCPSTHCGHYPIEPDTSAQMSQQDDDMTGAYGEHAR